MVIDQKGHREIIKQIEEAFKEMDINTDGQITPEEFIHACLSQETLSTMLALKVIDLFL